MKKTVVFIVFSLFLSVITFIPSDRATAASSEKDVEKQLEETVEDQLEGIDWESLQNFIDEECDDIGILGKSLSETAEDILSGNFSTDATTFLQYLADVFFDKIKSILPVLSGIAVICILSGVVSKTKSNLLGETTGNLINFFCFSTVLLFILSGIWNLLTVARKTIYSIKKLSDIAMPVLLTLMTATGAKTSAKVYTPTVALLTEGVTGVVAEVILPIFVFCVVFCIISNVSQEIKLKQLSLFFKNVSSWILGITFTVFTGFMSIQGLTAATIDGVSIRAAKFATKTYIPILGGYLADGFDLILTSCVLIKNCFGVIVLMVLLSVALSPILYIIVFNVGLHAVAAFTEPIADSAIVGFLTDVGKSLSILLVSVIAVTFMLFIMVMLIIFTANVI